MRWTLAASLLAVAGCIDWQQALDSFDAGAGGGSATGGGSAGGGSAGGGSAGGGSAAAALLSTQVRPAIW